MYIQAFVYALQAYVIDNRPKVISMGMCKRIVLMWLMY